MEKEQKQTELLVGVKAKRKPQEDRGKERE